MFNYGYIMQRGEAIIERRRVERLQAAAAAWHAIHDELERVGVKHRLFGSLARGTFQAHSDIDLMIFGELSLSERVQVRQIIDKHMMPTDIDCHLFFAADITAASVERLLGE